VPQCPTAGDATVQLITDRQTDKQTDTYSSGDRQRAIVVILLETVEAGENVGKTAIIGA